MHLTHKFPDNFSPQDWYGIRNSTSSSAYIKQMHEILAAIEQTQKAKWSTQRHETQVRSNILKCKLQSIGEN